MLFRSLLNSLFYDAKRYDLAHVGRYKYNKKLGLSDRLVDVDAAEDVIDPNTGEIIVEAGERISRELGKVIENAGVGKLNFFIGKAPKKLKTPINIAIHSTMK